MVDTGDLKSPGSDTVRVRVPSAAPSFDAVSFDGSLRRFYISFILPRFSSADPVSLAEPGYSVRA